MIKYIIPLFFLLTPGILWTYSKKHNKYSIALLHGCVFAFVFYFIDKQIKEGLTGSDKVTINYTSDLYTPENREKTKMFNNVYSTKKQDKATIVVNYDGKEKKLSITQRDFDDNFERAMSNINSLKEFKK